jgi:ribosomal protein S18 acetylase RimI-like enzyme
MTRVHTESHNRRSAIKIREMEIDDIAPVFHLGETLFKADETPTMYRTWDPYEVTNLFNSDTEFCLVAEEDEVLVGFALGTTITKNHSAWKYGYLIWLGVCREYQRKKVAEKLFNRFKDLMLKIGVRMLMVDTPAENKRAIRFFNKMGFGVPRPHVYLTMNLAADHQRLKMKTAGNGFRGTLHGQDLQEDELRPREGTRRFQ